MENEKRIRLGDSVIIRRGEHFKHVKVVPNKSQRVGSGLHVPVGELVGHCYGSSFQVTGNKLVSVEPSLVENTGEEMLVDNRPSEDGDNRDILDNCQSQKLDRDDIQSMKEKGDSGQKIVEQLVSNSSTFQERSNFSKAKYLRKKSIKHIPHFVAEYPTARLICQLLANEQYPKSMGLQVHTLGQILNWANVRSGAKVLVFESTQSFVTGAVMERLGNKGHIVQLYPGAYPVRTLLDDFNYSEELKKKVLHGYLLEKIIDLEEPAGVINKTQKLEENEAVSLETTVASSTLDEDLKPIQTITRVDSEISDAGPNTTKSDEQQTIITSPITDRTGAVTNEEDNGHRSVPSSFPTTDIREVNKSDQEMAIEPSSIENGQDKKEGEERTSSLTIDKKGTKRKLSGGKKEINDEPKPFLKWQGKHLLQEASIALELLKERNFDSLIIASKYNPKDTLLTLLKFLPPSRPFVVYCQYKEPLMECYVHLRNLQAAIDVEISTTWFRRIQALPLRTHPVVKSPGIAGYILRGTTVEITENSVEDSVE